MKSFDTIVVGAGTAGCVLAARLAQNSTQNVLLLEAGHNSATELNRLKRVGIIPSASDWQLSAATGRDGYRVYLPRAKAVGGCSLVQGGIALRGFPDDYSSWAVAAGNEWGPDSVLPVFKEIENDADFSSEGHGKDGPVHIERARPDELQNLHRAFIAASLERGLSWCADFNQGDGVGVGLIPRALRNGQRETVRECYLALPRRGSLSLLPDTTARRILLEQGQALGVECSEANGTDLKRFYAGAVVLCAGAIGSPDILLRSGVGPPDELDEAGQRVLHAAPAVGRNLRDHPAFWIEFSLEKEEAGGGHWFQVMSRALGAEINAPVDCAFETYHDFRLAPSRAAFRRGILWAVLLNSHGTGSVRLNPQSVDAAPDIFLNYEDARDISRLEELLRNAWSLMDTSSFRELGLNGVRLMTVAGFGGSGADVRERAIRGEAVRELLAQSGRGQQTFELTSVIRRCSLTAHHLHGSCRMGLEGDPNAVVNPAGGVYGIRNLFIADASVIPVQFRSNTHLCTIMIAEKVAAGLIG